MNWSIVYCFTCLLASVERDEVGGGVDFVINALSEVFGRSSAGDGRCACPRVSEMVRARAVYAKRAISPPYRLDARPSTAQLASWTHGRSRLTRLSGPDGSAPREIGRASCRE